jgi:5-hydroxyisourate hydrolase
MTSLSTHVLDTAHGVPANGVRLRLLRDGKVLFEGSTNPDGRCPELRDVPVTPGPYRLEFAVADYFCVKETRLSDPPFLDVVALEFALSEGHYHVPLLVSPYGYSTYRGS